MVSSGVGGGMRIGACRRLALGDHRDRRRPWPRRAALDRADDAARRISGTSRVPRFLVWGDVLGHGAAQLGAQSAILRRQRSP